MIKLENVTKVYKGNREKTINNLSLHIKEGELCVFLGPSGCGKSTTLKMINRMIEPTSGRITIGGKDIKESNPDELRMSIGYVIQQIGLLPHKSVEDNISIVPRLYGWDKEKTKYRVTELLEFIGLNPEEIRYKFPSQLSGGQMQRIGVARALACKPSIMLMDEPFGAVDPIARTKLQDEFLKIHKELNTTICFVTHDIDEAIKMGDKIAIFNSGEIVQYDTPSNILKNPANDFVKRFIGEQRILKNLAISKVWDIKEIKNKEIEEIDIDINFAIDINDSLEKALSIMIENNVDILPITNEAKILSYISFKDIRKYMSKEIE